MLPLTLGCADAPLNLLCLGAHADDIEIGAGGTIRALLERHRGSRVLWIVCSASPLRRREAEAGAREVQVLDFRDGFFPAELPRLKEAFEEVKARFQRRRRRGAGWRRG